MKYLTNVTIKNERRNMKTNGEFYFHLRNIRLNSVSERKSCFYGSTGYLWVFFASITRKTEPEQLLLSSSSSFPFIFYLFFFCFHLVPLFILLLIPPLLTIPSTAEHLCWPLGWFKPKANRQFPTLPSPIFWHIRLISCF